MANNWKLCRGCLNAEETFSYSLLDVVLAEMFNYCTSIEIHEHDDFPKSLCALCHDLLTKCYKFKEMCLQTQNTLNDLKLKTEKNESLTRVQENVHDMVKVENFTDDYQEDYFLDDDYCLTKADEKNTPKKKRREKKLGNLQKKYEKSRNKIKRKFTCDVCNKKFNHHERFEAHKLAHEGKVVPIHCLPCDKTFTTWSGLKRHTRNEHTLINFDSLKCTICGRICKTRDTLKIHEKTHKERLLHVCDVCGKDFSTKFVLKGHLETHKENREREYTCEHCGKKFFTNAMLLTHVSRRHTGRRFICHICNYAFTQKYNLAKHLLSHDGKKMYECDLCKKTFATHASLVEHKRIHSGERPFLCNFCPKSFLSKRRLNDHHKTHTGERPHKCSVCDLGFSQRGTLKRHMKVHDRPVNGLHKDVIEEIS